ncbi:U2 snRNP auxiliary factor large subunit [Quillaja saponaria]|uniref:U2 snRNP auxiliary factor large subunit n=1 Tax=Quillaja saponaria TaxID=32244 RepID=A0AAD7QE44_QUISA|nr:U2 snRNP auxiliary factor large subunit [Quillaja saponaria]KAJ7979819.1 U2 snRNP auxiliary factor large subunit [Quillaja saponaria]
MAGISRSSRLKEKHRKSSTLSLGNEGSAARTRPLSLEEIMLRRKNKEFPENVKDKVNEAWNISSRGSVENNVDHFESGTGYRHDKSLRSIVEKLVPDEQVNMSSIRKEENTSMKEDNLVEGKDKGTLRSEVNLKTKWNTDVRRMAREDKADKEMRGRRKKDGHLSDEYEYKADKKHSRDYNNMDRYSNRDTGNSEMEIKKRHQNVDDLNPGEGNTERKHEKHRHSRRKSNERQSDEFDCEAEKKHERDSYANRHRGRSERELKKRYQNVDDKKRGEGNAEKKHEKHRHNRRIGNELTSDDSEREAEKRHSRNSAGKHGYTDRSRENSEIEGKRKYQNGDDDRTRDRNAAKKHDMGKFHGLEKSERKERQEDKSERKERQEEKLERKSHYEESRAKRTLRSPEHEDRNKRSPSLSPRPHKRAYHGAEHEVLPPLSLEDRPRKQHSDLDRSRVSTNGSSSYHRRYGRSASGLGGYSPRKRRTEAAVRTPSPSNHSPEKKSAAWDLPPAGTESVFSAAVLSNFQLSNPTTVSSNTNELVSVAPVDSPPVKPSPLPSISSSSIRSIAPIDSVQLTQATRPMRRLYLENVPSSASEKAIIDCLNDFLLSASVNHFQGVNPCISCIINKEKGQALVEFLTPEDASAALSFDASTLCGSIVRIRRPKDYVEVADIYMGFVVIHVVDGDEADS